VNDDLLTSDIDTSSDLVTVASFDDSVSASLVMNRLKHAGLPAVLSQENVVTWFWYLSNAFGGIGVQVNSKDAEAARCLIEQHERLTAADAAAAEAGSEAETEAEKMIGDDVADLSTADAEAETAAANSPETDQDPLGDEPASTERERNADRAARGAVLGIMFLPLQLYVLYLLLFRVFASEESLDDRHLHRSIAAGVINFVVLVGFYLQGGLDRPIARVDAQASRLIRFVDDKGGELTRPPGGKPVNPFFENNKPIIVKLGPKSHAENVSGTENGFLPLMCPKSVPDTLSAPDTLSTPFALCQAVRESRGRCAVRLFCSS